MVNTTLTFLYGFPPFHTQVRRSFVLLIQRVIWCLCSHFDSRRLAQAYDKLKLRLRACFACLHDSVCFRYRMSGATEQMISQEHLWIVVREHDDSGQGCSTGHLPFEFDGTSEREPDGTDTGSRTSWEIFFLAAALDMDDLKGIMERDDTLERKFDSTSGLSVLITWVSTTWQDYIEQCWFKFGGVEGCKTRSEMGMSKQDAWNNLGFIILGGSADAEFVTGAFLGPRGELVAENDVGDGLYSDVQTHPIHRGKISVQQKMAETMYQNLGTAPSEVSIDVILMLSLVCDIVVESLWQSVPTQNLILIHIRKINKGCGASQQFRETMKKQFSWMVFFLLLARLVPGLRPPSHTSGRVRERPHLRVCQWGKSGELQDDRRLARRELHNNLREDDQRKDNQDKMRRKDDSSCHIRRSWEKIIDPAWHDILGTQEKWWMKRKR